MVGMSEGMSLLVECLGGHLCTTNVAVVPLSLNKYYFMKMLMSLVQDGGYG